MTRRQYKTRHEIELDILSTLRESRDGVNITHIMYTTRTTFRILQKYLNWLIKDDMVEKDCCLEYHITAKGHQYLEYLIKARELRT